MPHLHAIHSSSQALLTSHKAQDGGDQQEELVVHEEKEYPHHHTANQHQQTDDAKGTGGQKLVCKPDMGLRRERANNSKQYVPAGAAGEYLLQV